MISLKTKWTYPNNYFSLYKRWVHAEKQYWEELSGNKRDREKKIINFGQQQGQQLYLVTSVLLNEVGQ